MPVKKTPIISGALKNFNLEANQLSQLPESIGKLTNIKKLSLWQNKLNSLPQTFTQLKSLQALDLGENPLKQIPLNFGDLKSLKTLRMNTSTLDKSMLLQLQNSLKGTMLSQTQIRDIFKMF